MAARTIRPLRSDAGVIRSRIGRGVRARSTAIRPAAVPSRNRSPVAAGEVAEPGSANPIASATQAMVEAVPITMQVPPVVASACWTSTTSSWSSSPARCSAHIPRQSVHAPNRRPRQDEVSIGPATSVTADAPADTAPMICAGTVLSQPPTRTTASIGWARIDSSTSIAARLRNIIDVGFIRISGSDMLGNTIGSPPACVTPRLTAPMSWGISR